MGRLDRDSHIVYQTTISQHSNIMAEFWSYERTTRLCELCLQRLLPLTTNDVQSWVDDPEAFFLTQDSLQPSESLRVSGEQVL